MTRFVIEHGAPGRTAGVIATQWRDSALPFEPRLIQGYDRRYATKSQARCSICGAEFAYKGRKSSRGMRFAIIALVVVVLLSLVCARFNLEAVIVLLLISGALVLVTLALAIRPREPYLQQLSGPVRSKHRVRPLR